MEGEREEEHEGAEGRVRLQVHMHVLDAALQATAVVAVPMAVPVAGCREQGGTLLTNGATEVQDDSLQDEHHEKATGHDEFSQGEAGWLEDSKANQLYACCNCF